MHDAIPTDDGRGPSPAELAAAQFAIRPELNASLIAVINSIADIADRDCYGSDNVKEGDPCDCDTCSAKRAIAQLNQIRLPVVRSLRPDRLNYAERVYFDAWVTQNTRSPGFNSGFGTLELLLRTETEPAPQPAFVTKPAPQPAFVSQRDMDVATTVIQWLGTNCGRCFVESCERARCRGMERISRKAVVSPAEPQPKQMDLFE